jgi:hypothetical protein
LNFLYVYSYITMPYKSFKDIQYNINNFKLIDIIYIKNKKLIENNDITFNIIIDCKIIRNYFS